MIRRKFTPSYDAETREDYYEKVRKGKKRLEHVQVERGRVRLRYDEESPTHDPPSTRTPLKISRDALQRLVRIEPPFAARTQSQPSRDVSFTDRTKPDQQLVERIRRGLNAFMRVMEMEGRLTVPRDPRQLVAAGVPERAAYILYRRAKGKTFSSSTGSPLAIDPIESLGSKISFVLGQPPRVRVGEGVSRGRASRTEGLTMLVFSLPGQRREAEITKFRLVTPNLVSTVWTAESIDQAYDQMAEPYRRSGVPFSRRELDLRFLREVIYTRLLQSVRSIAQRDKTEDVSLIVTITSGKGSEERRIPVGEHSKETAPVDEKLSIGYKSLKNVTLEELPAVLARLSRRHHHKAPPEEFTMARRNPNEDRFWFEQYAQGPYGAREAVPVSRRNPRKKKGSRKATKGMSTARRTQLSRVMSRARELLAAKGCSAAEAMKAAWAAERGAKSNPWYSLESSPLYLPDETQTRSALVRGPYGDLAFTNPHAPEDFSRAEADLPDMWGRSDFWGGSQTQRGGYSMRGGQFSASGTGGFQPVNRRNPRRDSKGRFVKANGRKSR